MEETTEHVQEDIVIQPRTLVTRYLHGQAFCPASPSLVQTARRQDVHLREFLQTLLTADTATAQAALKSDAQILG